MKKGIHPENYRPVVFKDMSNGDVFLSRSTVNTKETIEFEGETYPLVKLEISSTSHPFYTGKSKLVDTAGRVDKFMSRYGNRKKLSVFQRNGKRESATDSLFYYMHTTQRQSHARHNFHGNRIILFR